jgi:FtsP/CotA-like multicopper oxidase with cupredoxin domain
MGITRLNVVAGLAGMYFLRDEYDTGTADNTLGLPSGEFEVPLILADRRFHDDGSLNFRTVRYVPQGHWEGGMIGDRMTVNGMVSPYFRVARGRYRFRVLNASNVRGYHLFFTNRMPFWVIANDGGLLDAAVRTTEVRVTPGERIDLVVDFSGLGAGETVELTNDQKESAGPRPGPKCCLTSCDSSAPEQAETPEACPTACAEAPASRRCSPRCRHPRGPGSSR